MYIVQTYSALNNLYNVTAIFYKEKQGRICHHFLSSRTDRTPPSPINSQNKAASSQGSLQGDTAGGKLN